MARSQPADRARPAAVQVSARPVVLVGSGLFLLAFLVLLPCYGALQRHGHTVWLWTALAGWLIGLASLPLVGKHRREGRTR